MKAPHLLRMFVMSMTALALSCSWVANVTSKGTEAIGRLLLSEDQEKRLGAQLAAQVKQEAREHPDPTVQQYVDEVAATVLASVPEDQRRRMDFTFTVLDAPGQVNAFALPGGHIFVLSGLLEASASEAEFASVIGHEIAHVLAGHPSQQLAAQVGVQTLGSLALGQNAGVLQQLAANIVATGYLSAHTREMEEEADLLGVRYLSAAGYDPGAMSDFFAKLGKMEKGGRNVVENFVATHPAPAARSERITRIIQEQGLGAGSDARVGGLAEIKGRLPSEGIGGSGPAN